MSKLKYRNLSFDEIKEDRKWFARGFLEEYTIIKQSIDVFEVYTSKYLSEKPKKSLKAAKLFCQKHNNEKLDIVVNNWIILGE